MPARHPLPSIGLPLRPWVLRLVLALGLAGSLAAQVSREYDLKAVFLYNFATFVEWPKEARPPSGRPIIIGILGRDPFGKVLDDVVAGEKLNGNPLEVRRYATAEAAREAHILFVCASEATRLPQILDQLRGRPVLTVADIPRFAEAGGIVTFSTGARVQLQINAAAARQSGLAISSKLLRVATVVDPVAHAMTLLADLPVQRKLRYAMLLTSSLALVLACAVFLTVEYRGYRLNLTQTVATLARIMADNSTASLAFDDPAAAQQTLRALEAEPQISAAVLYRTDGSVMAQYQTRPTNHRLSDRPGPPGVRFEEGEVVAVQPVIEGAHRHGTLYLCATQELMLDRVRTSFWVALAILVFSTAFAALLALALGRTLARPILELDRTVDAVTANQDYSLRARQYGEDELGRLTTAFNGMLATMQQSVAALRESEQRFRVLADHAPVLIWLTDEYGRHAWHNQRWLDFTGRTQVTEAGEGWANGLHPEDREWTLRLFHAAGETHKEFQLEYRLRRADGEYRWMMSRGLPRHGDGQEFTGFIGSSIDVTDFKLAEQAVAEARDRAIAASRSKDNFLAALSHELRTPLTPVLLLASEEAVNPRLSPEVRADFEMIAKNVALEARLIDDLLDLTRITRGKLVLDQRPADAHVILQDALTTVQPDFQDRRIKVEVVLAAPRHRLHGDPVRLQQVFWNVLKNAAKFTPKGGKVTVETHVVDRSRLLVRVTDTGMGMTPEELGRIFEAFSQGDHAETAATHQFGGLGLGLAISERLVQLHGGTIRASSAGRGQGAVFEIELPLDYETHTKPPLTVSTSPLETAARPRQPADGKFTG